MIRPVHSILVIGFCLIIGCAGRIKPVIVDRVTLFLPGVAGDGDWYDGVVQNLGKNGTEPVEIISWGASKAVFFQNFSDKSIHDTAEIDLAKRLKELTGKRVILVGHSAGCGVILGALGKTQTRVAKVVLLSPSVSPEYDLSTAVKQIDGKLQVYFSENDTLYLSWRTSHFGTYDRINSPAAGNCGFDLKNLPEADLQHIEQYRYRPEWNNLGNDGGHFGSVSGDFIRSIVLPVMDKR